MNEINPEMAGALAKPGTLDAAIRLHIARVTWVLDRLHADRLAREPFQVGWLADLAVAVDGYTPRRPGQRDNSAMAGASLRTVGSFEAFTASAMAAGPLPIADTDWWVGHALRLSTDPDPLVRQQCAVVLATVESQAKALNAPGGPSGVSRVIQSADARAALHRLSKDPAVVSTWSGLTAVLADRAGKAGRAVANDVVRFPELVRQP